MERLNEDCQRYLFSHLSLKDQVNTFRSLPSTRDTLCLLWNRKCRRLEINFSYLKPPFTYEEFDFFLQQVWDVVEDLSFEQIPSTLMQALCKYSYPQVHTLNLSTEYPGLQTIDIPLLQRMFPNLRNYRPKGNFSGKYFPLWTKMQSLKLDRCVGIQEEQLEPIIRQMPLRKLTLNTLKDVKPLSDATLVGSQLQTLTLNSSELALLLPDQIRLLRCLKELRITEAYFTTFNQDNFRQLHAAFGRYKSLEVVGVSTHNVALVLPVAIDFKFHTNIQKLIFSSDLLAFEEMVRYVDMLPALRQLYFVQCHVHSEKSFCTLLLKATQVDYISITNSGIDELELVLDVNAVMRARDKRPLHLNFYRNWRGVCCEFETKIGFFEATIELYLEGSHKSFSVTGKQLRLATGFATYEFKTGETNRSG